MYIALNSVLMAVIYFQDRETQQLDYGMWEVESVFGNYQVFLQLKEVVGQLSTLMVNGLQLHQGVIRFRYTLCRIVLP